MLCGVDLPQCQLVMVFVVQNVHEVGVERVDVIQLGEFVQYGRKLVVEVLLGELHLPRVELSDSGYLVVFVDHGGSLALGLGEDDVNEVLGRGHYSDLLEVIVSSHCVDIELEEPRGARGQSSREPHPSHTPRHNFGEMMT